MRRPHIEPAQRTVRYHSAPSPNSLATIARLISFPIRFVCRTGSPPLCDFDVLCRRFATVADDFEFDLLALIEGGESGPFHRRDMNEHVLSTSFRLDEAVAFGWVEPLYISYCHLDISGTLKDVLTQAARFRRIIQGDQSAFRPVYMFTSDQRTTAARSSQTIEDYSVSVHSPRRPSSNMARTRLSTGKGSRPITPQDNLAGPAGSRSMLNSADRKTHPEVSSVRL